MGGFLHWEEISELQENFHNSPEMEKFRESLRKLIAEYLPQQDEDGADLQGQMAQEIHRVALEFFPNFRSAAPPRGR